MALFLFFASFFPISHVIHTCIHTYITYTHIHHQLLFLYFQWGVPTIHIVCVIASHQGLATIQKAHPDIYVTVGMVDEGITDSGIVLPGLGDCGDRLFGTPITLTAEEELDDDESLVHISKRSRNGSIDTTLESIMERATTTTTE